MKIQKKAPATKKKAIRKKGLIVAVRQHVNNLRDRRPHRSFRLTRRRDYERSLKLPGYWSFTISVLKTIKQNKKAFLGLGSLYILGTMIFLGLGSQESFDSLRETLNTTGQEVFQGNWGEVGKASLLAFSTVAGNISPELTEVQQLYSVILGLVVWLSIVWLLRQRLAGNKVGVRDALYNSGAPIVATVLIFIVLIVQLLPIILALIGFSAAQASGLLSGGVEAMLFWATAGGLAVLSLYWMTSTFLALVIITLPGMYPVRALSIAGDMVIGRRVRIMYRLLWMLFFLVILWIGVLTAVVLVDSVLKSVLPAVSFLPVIPVVLVIISTSSLIFSATYVYLLYRKIVDDDAKPA